MSQLSEGHRQLLTAIRETLRRKKTPDVDTVREIGRSFFEDKLVDWEPAIESLVGEGLLEFSNGVYNLTERGMIKATKIHGEIMRKGFSEGLVKHEKSKVYSEYCERLYGKDLCQFNMMDMQQLTRLLDVLRITQENCVLDLGCGIGTVTEYISDRTGARITGIDFAPGAIDRALERTENKRDRLNYMVGDLNRLDMPDDSFDTLICIDTLYFVENLRNTVGQMKRIMATGGQMGLFFSQKANPDDSKECLLPHATDLAQALSAHALVFRTWDFTHNEHDHWRRSLDLAEEMKASFDEESNLGIYMSRIEEGTRLLRISEESRSSRFLYHVH